MNNPQAALFGRGRGMLGADHPDKATAQRLLLLYAWNENGTGGHLTPTEADGTKYLEAVERAITADH